MAKKKQTTQEQKEIKFDLELLTHKYSDYYIDFKTDKKIISNEEKEQSENNFVWYDTKEVFYPIYKAKVSYEISKTKTLHPIVIEILKILEYLHTLKDINIAMIQNITQLDSEILGSILADLERKGYLGQDLSLTQNGKEILQKEKEKTRANTSAFVGIDGIFGTILECAKQNKDIFLVDRPSKDSIELKPDGHMRPHTQSLNEEFSENKTLRQILIEGLNGLDKVDEKEEENREEDNKNNVEICEINTIESIKKFYKRYICLFYKNVKGDEKFLVLDDKHEIDRKTTERFDKMIDTSKFNAKENDAFKQNQEKFDTYTPEKIKETLDLDLSQGKTLEMQEHKKYFLYSFEHAKKAVYIQSPWVRIKVLKQYKDKIEQALDRGIKIMIKYGMKPRNRFDKDSIDEESRQYFATLKEKYPNLFFTKEVYDHSKIVICDEEFMIIGSFNWLSFSGEKERSETSNINKTKREIQKKIKKFL